MKPKTMRKKAIRGKRKYSGIAVDLFSSISVDLTAISETVEVNNPISNPIQSISESVLVAIT